MILGTWIPVAHVDVMRERSAVLRLNVLLQNAARMRRWSERSVNAVHAAKKVSNSSKGQARILLLFTLATKYLEYFRIIF